MLIFTAYYGNPRAKALMYTGRCKSVSLTKPAWFSCESISELAPTWELKKLADAGKYTIFEQKYREQLNCLGVETIRSLITNNDILLCHEASGFCHRHILGKWLEEKGVSIIEL